MLDEVDPDLLDFLVAGGSSNFVVEEREDGSTARFDLAEGGYRFGEGFHRVEDRAEEVE